MKQFNFIDLLALRDHVSISFLNSMLSCPMRAVLGSVLKLDAPSKSKSPALLRGSMLHKALEYYFLKAQAREITHSLEALQDSLDKALDYYDSKREYYDSDVLDKAIEFYKNNTQLQNKLAEFLDMNFLSKLVTSDKYIQTELSFTKLPICGFNFDGRIDLIFGNEVIDFKTTSRDMISSSDTHKQTIALSKVKREFALQLLTYKLALQQIEPTRDVNNILRPDAEHFSIIEVILTKAVPINYYRFTKQEVEQALSELSDRVSIVINMLKDKRVYRNFRDTFCPCEYAPYCMDDSGLDSTLSKLNLPKDFF